MKIELSRENENENKKLQKYIFSIFYLCEKCLNFARKILFNKKKTVEMRLGINATFFFIRRIAFKQDQHLTPKQNKLETR